MWGELLLSGLTTALGIAMYVDALNLPEGLFGTLGPGYFPKIILVCLIAASGLLFVRQGVRAIAALRKPDDNTPLDKKALLAFYKRYRFVAFAFAAFFLYLLSMKWLGFLVSTLAFMVLTMWILAPAEKNWRTVRIVLITSVMLTFGLFGLFTYAFSVMLPSGSLY